MQHPTPLPLVPGSWDELIARAALKAVDWLHDRLPQRGAAHPPEAETGRQPR
jgi:hypothetical protein